MTGFLINPPLKKERWFIPRRLFILSCFPAMPSPSTSPMPKNGDKAVNEFLQQLEQGRGVSPNTVRNYRQALLEFKATAPNKSWWEMKPADFKAYLYSL